jgi:hypothetical protein
MGDVGVAGHLQQESNNHSNRCRPDSGGGQLHAGSRNAKPKAAMRGKRSPSRMHTNPTSTGRLTNGETALHLLKP